MAAFASLALGALAPPPPAQQTLKSEMAVDSDDQLMDDEPSGDVDMFEFELNGLDTASTAPTTTLRSDGSGSGGEDAASHGLPWSKPRAMQAPRDFRQPPLVARPSFAATHAQQPAVAYGISAPPLGAFALSSSVLIRLQAFSRLERWTSRTRCAPDDSSPV